MNKELITRTIIKVRFSEVDSMGIVWHGQYVKYFEDGREDFGNTYGLNYLDFYKRGVLIPVVKLECDYKKPLVYGDTAIVETRFVRQEAAKIRYEYVIRNHKTGDLVATGYSLQVFLNMNRELLLAFPAFFIEWKEKHGLITQLNKLNLS
jgi:acyl-CoA thioester hydrolase